MSPAVSAAAQTDRTLRLALGAGAALYALGFMLWYAATPLGRVPLLDGRELLDLAEQIAAGTLAPEPFYRAPLYSALLALLLKLGLDPSWLAGAGRTVNLAAHLAAAGALARIAGTLGATRNAVLLAFVLWAVNPVALHLAADPLDITFALALALWGAALTLETIGNAGPSPAGAARRAIAAGLLLGLAVIARPNFLPLLLAAIALLFVARRRSGDSLAPAASTAIGAVAVLLALGAINLARTGEFRILPWQGPYALWAANRPESNGRYYEQLIESRNLDRHVNPARVESETLYRSEAPAGAPTTIAAMNRHWLDRLAARVAGDPLSWSALVVARGYYLLNDFEQYDNKTYFVQRAASPWLRWNPLGFGVMLVLAAFSLAARGIDRLAACHLLLGASYLAGALLFYASDRFRLPLAAMLVPLAALAPQAWLGSKARARALVAAALAAVLAFWPLPSGLREATVHDDLMLESQARLQLGDYEGAERSAEAALARDPRPSFGWELLCTSRYNRLLARLPEPVPVEAERQGLAACLDARARSDRARVLGAVFQWRAGSAPAALATWRAVAGADSPAQSDACALLVLARDLPASPPPACLRTRESGLALVLLAMLDDPAARAALPSGTNLARERARLEQLLAIPKPAAGTQ